MDMVAARDGLSDRCSGVGLMVTGVVTAQRRAWRREHLRVPGHHLIKTLSAYSSRSARRTTTTLETSRRVGARASAPRR